MTERSAHDFFRTSCARVWLSGGDEMKPKTSVSCKIQGSYGQGDVRCVCGEVVSVGGWVQKVCTIAEGAEVESLSNPCTCPKIPFSSCDALLSEEGVLACVCVRVCMNVC